MRFSFKIAQFRKEADIQNPQDPYGISKWEAEQALHKIIDKTGMDLVVLRPPLVYGPGVKANFLRLLKAVDRGIPLPFGNVTNRRLKVINFELDGQNSILIRNGGKRSVTGRMIRHGRNDTCMHKPVLLLVDRTNF